MKKKGKILYILILSTPLLLCGGNSLFPVLGGQRAGTSVFTFLKIGIGARAGGMGNAAVSLAEDATTLYWNPAAAGQVKGNVLTFSHTKWPVDISYSYFGYIHRLTLHDFIGVSSGALYMDPMEITTEYKPYGTGEYFNFGDIYLGLTYARRMTDKFSFGVTLKYVEETLADLSMHNVLLDLGTFYWTGYKTLRFCVSLVNFGPQSRPEGTYFKPLKEGGQQKTKYTLFSPPTEFRIGSAMYLIDKPKNKLLMSVQLNHPVDNAENFVIGIEEEIMNILLLRGGWLVNQSERSFSIGGGIKASLGSMKFTADLAYLDFGVLGNILQLQMSFGFKCAE